MRFAASSFAFALSAGTAVVGRQGRSFGPWLAPLANWIAGRNRSAGQAERVSRRSEPAGTAAVAANDIALKSALPARLPLRVLRVVDGTSRQCAGRMVISGRMADVCAELDRLAAREAQSLADRRPTVN